MTTGRINQVSSLHIKLSTTTNSLSSRIRNEKLRESRRRHSCTLQLAPSHTNLCCAQPQRKPSNKYQHHTNSSCSNFELSSSSSVSHDFVVFQNSQVSVSFQQMDTNFRVHKLLNCKPMQALSNLHTLDWPRSTRRKAFPTSHPRVFSSTSDTCPIFHEHSLECFNSSIHITGKPARVLSFSAILAHFQSFRSVTTFLRHLASSISPEIRVWQSSTAHYTEIRVAFSSNGRAYNVFTMCTVLLYISVKRVELTP